MTTPQPHRSINDPITAIPSFEDIAVHLSQQIGSSPSGAATTDTSSLPLSLNQQAVSSGRPTPPVPTLAPAPTTTVVEPAVAHENELPPSSNILRKLQQLRTAFDGFGPQTERGPGPDREPLHHRDRFAGDPRDDVRLDWADESAPWRHFDVEARMVHRETLWIAEKLEELFLKYLKPVWWDRFVEGISDFLATISKELIRPVWSFVAAPFLALTQWIPDIDWPWNFELRGPNVSVKQSPFRRMVFDSQLAPQVAERLWDDPDEYLDVGQTVMKDDYSAVARIPVKAPSAEGHFRNPAIGLLKRFNLRSVTHTLTRLLLFTRGSRTWAYGRELLSAGVSTARPLAMVEDRLGPLRFRSFVLTENVEGTPLSEFIEQTPLNTLELDRLAGQFARIWHTLGELRIVHGAMHAVNFVVTPDRQLKLINLDGAWRHWFDLTFLHRRDRDWLRFMKSWRGQPEIGAAFRAAVARYFEETVAETRQASEPLSIRWQRAA